jgi:glutathione-regulated potassium-efflux system ancillary protein KefF
MNWLPPVVLHDADNADANALADHIAHVCGRLGTSQAGTSEARA